MVRHVVEVGQFDRPGVERLFAAGRPDAGTAAGAAPLGAAPGDALLRALDPDSPFFETAMLRLGGG